MSTKRLIVMCLPILFFWAGCQTVNVSQDFQSDWTDQQDRIWLGESYWANRLQDWQIKNGRIECVVDRMNPMRTVHLLTARLGERPDGFEMSVRSGLMAPENGTDQSATGFLVGVGHGEIDYRSAAIVQWWPGKGAGLFAGITGDGRLFIRDNEEANQPQLATGDTAKAIPRDVLIKLTARPQNTNFELCIEAWDPMEQQCLDKTSCTVSGKRLIGNVALVSHPGVPKQTSQSRPENYWFEDWQLRGDKVTRHASDTCGPILCTQYTLSRNILKMTAQLMPIGDDEPQDVQLQVKHSGAWKTVAKEKLVTPGWTATFRLPQWNSDKDVPYRVTWNKHSWGGTIRHDPVDKSSIVVAGFTGNHNNSHQIGGGWGAAANPDKNNWLKGMWFPHAEIVHAVSQHKPDVLFFSGDQVYEGKSPTYADGKHIKLDYLYKWYMWCWAYRDLTKDIPAVTMPDDHDVYQGNLWGEGGRKSPGKDHHGGYVHPADFVSLVDRTQTSHLPDPYDSTPLEQGITAYYTDMIYGGVGFAVLEDRKFKSGCARPEMPASGTARPDHFNDPDFDIASLDIPGVKLLGDKQLQFLHEFAQDWTGQEMKMALSQTIFANMATHHGPGLTRLRSDLDSNGWPQTGRNKAVDALRRGFMFHLAGDQHLATLVHHGIEEYGDAMWSMCVPSVANFYPRAWAPRCDMPYKMPEPEEYLGQFKDGFGHPVTVYAAANPGEDMGQANHDLHDKMPGYGIVRINKDPRTYTVECWPRFANPDKDKQYKGWPKTITQQQNYGRKAYGYLPSLLVESMTDPVVQVYNEETADVVYTLRIKGTRFKPKVFEMGTYTIKVSDPENQKMVEIKSLQPGPSNETKILKVKP